jgi:hypothetical protein
MIAINLNKAKAIAHEKRRAARDAEFAPLDVKATIPLLATQAEDARQSVRDKYEAMQAAIDAAQTLDQLKSAMSVDTDAEITP